MTSRTTHNRSHSECVRATANPCARSALVLTDETYEDEGVGFRTDFSSFCPTPTAGASTGALQDAGLIRYRGGTVNVLDLERLGEASCECYCTIRYECERVLAPQQPKALGQQR